MRFLPFFVVIRPGHQWRKSDVLSHQSDSSPLSRPVSLNHQLSTINSLHMETQPPLPGLDKIVKPFRFAEQPYEYKVVPLRECPTPETLLLCDTPDKAADYLRSINNQLLTVTCYGCVTPMLHFKSEKSPIKTGLVTVLRFPRGVREVCLPLSIS